MKTTSRPGLWALITAAVFALCGAFLTVGGAWLASLGGPLYYVILGLALLATAFLAWRKNEAALWLFALVTLGTLGWAFSEVGLDIWGLLPRLDIVLILGVWLLLPFVYRQVGATRASVLPLAGSVGLGVLALLASLFTDPYDISGQLPTQIANAAPADPDNVPDSEWHAYGRTQAGDRWSPLKQINSSNVQNLQVAWKIRTGDLMNSNDPGEATNEATPIEFDNTLYTCSLHQKLFAIDGATGKVKWVYDPKLQIDPGFQHLTCRGVSFHETAAGATDTDGQPAPTDCAKRIILPVNDGRLVEVDAATGEKCHGFGEDGEINPAGPHQPFTTAGLYEPTSPPVITDKLIIVNSAITDNGSVRQPSGATKAYDVYTGKLVWVFDASNPDPNQMPGDDHPHFHPNSPNSWIVSSYDKNLNLVYIPMGVGTPDQWGGYRTKESERFAPGVIALNADTGKLAWFYQTVHHDLWDMDLPSQMSLVDITQKDGSIVPAIYAPAKTGDIFVLDRRTGKEIVPAPETAVPQGAAPGDHVSPTQPESKLSLRPKNPISNGDIWGGTIFDQMFCQIYFHQLRYEGPFTPPSLQGSLIFPGDLGMFEWGGLSVDPQRQVAFANPISLPFVSRLVPRGPGNPLWPDANAKGTGGETGLQHNYGIPYAVDLHPFLDPVLLKVGIKMPCRTPPWGYVAGIDLRTNKVVWQHRNGTLRDSMYGSALPIQLPPIKIGVPSLGGPLSTAGNVGFLTSSMDYYIRAYDITNGKTLWQDRLPAGGQSTPMTYAINGKQYIVTYAGGHNSFPSRMGDYLIAYALPDQK
ncbi:glucose/quinate/shikimate family membrane-bound PQQ-dependent dehydrogenase [Gluconobacter wancherniae]|uniref:glucose/quinate/shikimate family membrane-bound PQQ-dependent dehydrogenase n=1 Tax=Gluconobacter wancherniae TaxID=1307955 RepID=UPI0011BDC391|nr:glucose/quinate/shikimate family membrane-bound PQQ-dependent dehydrogenase [Gluconobacter wancherniae]MBF0853847.1 glucose/quinate/shikimate family membrane-bound PQQ-dependent dehydrogenase [Gluconobacter wancherniae]MBS1062233.1 glucose/quinate/shikimate family membrane-bound PQQ-dependent dehydrogenase [Gluconobacter wancherniae]MBS1089107.1 glucose/quinate/shikimate family membrane-bound PQQ-dependent dehydrogenase [Gluconobacter wancherniae]MBS1094275.1 glucose/quinate/shikimate family